MIVRLEVLYRKARRWVSRSEWGVRMLGLSRSKGMEVEPGLVMVQIDGLSRKQLERALMRGKMPFLNRLLQKEGYKLHTHYSGIPASTPAVQGELFYGVKGVVPAFSFVQRQTRKVVRMFDTEPAAEIQKELEKKGTGLLKGGSSYCNIFSGGADHSHFCPSTFGWDKVFRSIRPWAFLSLVLFNIWSLFRIGALLVLEFVLAVFDFIRGLIDRQDIGKEFKFVPTRVAICILLRELIVLGAKMDVTRGLPIVHLNLIGYDEQAHRRNPSSNFAHWTLKGIDDAIKRICSTARRSSGRDYELWVYSDHGQEKTIPYPDENGKTVHEAITEVFHHLGPVQMAHPKDVRGAQLERSKWLGQSFLNWLFDAGNDGNNQADPEKVVVTAMGSVGHVYSPIKLDAEERDRAARLLVEKAHIPLVLVPTQPGRAQAWTSSEELNLPEEGIKILGTHHPFAEEVIHDLINLCHHPDAGDFIISGWRLGKTSISFPLENGSHTGPGPEETRAFALLPATALVPRKKNGYLRPLDLRQGVQRTLDPQSWKRNNRGQRSAKSGERYLRIMTYNVHSCIGMDGKLSPDRIARVIAHYDPDIVALQELDVGRQRTGDVDQAHRIANNLEMDFHFHPALELEEELYGDAILSRFPMSLKRAAPLPGLPHRPDLEKRGALWVSIDIEGREIQLINTHLGLRKKERILQTEALLGRQWLAHPDCRGPTILCGDFNALPNSNVCKRICQTLKDAQATLHNHRPQRTWFGRYPVGRIDHVFVSDEFRMLACQVPRNAMTCLASDHLPLIVELALPGQ